MTLIKEIELIELENGISLLDMGLEEFIQTVKTLYPDQFE